MKALFALMLVSTAALADDAALLKCRQLEDGPVRLIELTKRLRKLPTKPKYLTSAEITRVSQRLSTIGSNGLPIPKGMDPRKARINRRALRGR